MVGPVCQAGVAGLLRPSKTGDGPRGAGREQVPAAETQPLLPMTFGARGKRTHDYVRHGTTNLFAALNVGTGEVIGECKPTRNGADFLAFVQAAVKPHTVREVHVVLDNCPPTEPRTSRPGLPRTPLWTSISPRSDPPG